MKTKKRLTKEERRLEMTVKEFKAYIETLPDDYQVVTSSYNSFEIAPVNQINITEDNKVLITSK
jgi:hypothetical protein